MHVECDDVKIIDSKFPKLMRSGDDKVIILAIKYSTSNTDCVDAIQLYPQDGSPECLEITSSWFGYTDFDGGIKLSN